MKNHKKRVLKAKGEVGMLKCAALAAALASGLPVAAADATEDRSEVTPAAVRPAQTGSDGEVLRSGDTAHVANETTEAATLESSSGNSRVFEKSERSTREHASEGATDGQSAPFQLAQFQLPPAPPREGTGPAQQDARKMVMPAALTFQYAIGSDTETTVLKNPDLNGRNGDDSVFVAPNMFGLFIYRPNAWLEGTLEMTLERMIALQREPVVTMPDGSSQQAEELRWSLLVDQIYATAKDLGPFELSVGRRNFEDPRLWLYDAALDTVFAKVRLGDVHTELSVSRENYFDGELLYDVPISVRGRTDNRILYMEYRGIEDHKMAAYAIKRIDYTGSEGRPLHTGVRAYGSPTDSFRYWSELGFSLNHDASNDKLSGFGFDLGATYRFMDHPLQPTITLGYSFGSGDADETDNVNREFRQTGLQSNEGRFGGVTQFKRYGEFLDPELSNLNILTAGFSFRPAPNAFVDLVYHRYRLDEYAIELRSSGVTALMNQDPTRLTKEVGQEVDLIIGFRNLFGLRRFGFEARIGYFLPGDAYRIPESYPDNPPFRKANTGVSGLFVIII